MAVEAKCEVETAPYNSAARWVVPRFHRGWSVTNTVLILSIGPRKLRVRVVIYARTHPGEPV